MDVEEFKTLEAAIQDEESTIWSDAPALAASTVKMVNTSGERIGLWFSSATNVTVIKVNDVTLTGRTTTAGYIPLRPNDNVAFTYTSTGPVLQWFREG